MIPALLPDGHLPVGRHRCTLDEVEEAFVDADWAATDGQRRVLFDNLLRYLESWEAVHDELDEQLLEHLWIGGSFASCTPNPSDIDVSPLLDGQALARVSGRKGSGHVKALFEQRAKVRTEFGVEPFAIVRQPFTTFNPRKLATDEHTYVTARGIFDDFWQRRATELPAGAMLEEDAVPRRGYLEVDPWL